jgi:hypothetical protein
LAESFGTRHYGRINGTMTTRILAFQAGAPLLAGVLHAWFGSYQALLALMSLSSLVASGLFLTCPPYQSSNPTLPQPRSA